MKRLFIIPTWINHFDKNITFLRSCGKFNINIPIKFVVSDVDEKIHLEYEIESQFKSSNMDIEVIEIEKIIQKFKPEITINDIEDIKNSTKRFPNIWAAKHPYQGIKKIYALKYFDFDQAMLLDSECAFVKNTNVDELFDEYFENPYVFYSPHYEVNPNLRIFTDAAQKCLRWCDVEDAKDKWFFENLYWMVDKKILNDMFLKIETNLGMDLYTEYTTNAGEIFEIITYYSYIYINNNKYKYNFINYYDNMQKYMGESFTEYAYLKPQRLGGLLEFMFENIDDRNYQHIINFINDYKIRFCRPDHCDINLYAKAVRETSYLNMILACENSANLLKLLTY